MKTKGFLPLLSGGGSHPHPRQLSQREVPRDGLLLRSPAQQVLGDPSGILFLSRPRHSRRQKVLPCRPRHRPLGRGDGSATSRARRTRASATTPWRTSPPSSRSAASPASSSTANAPSPSCSPPTPLSPHRCAPLPSTSPANPRFDKRVWFEALDTFRPQR